MKKNKKRSSISSTGKLLYTSERGTQTIKRKNTIAIAKRSMRHGDTFHAVAYYMIKKTSFPQINGGSDVLLIYMDFLSDLKYFHGHLLVI